MKTLVALVVAALAGCATHETPRPVAYSGPSPEQRAEWAKIKAMEREMLANAIRDIHEPPKVHASAGTLEDRVSDLEYRQRIAALDSQINALR